MCSSLSESNLTELKSSLINYQDLYSTFFSHRPLDLNNVFKENIKILVKDGDRTIDDIPEPEKVIEYVRMIC